MLNSERDLIVEERLDLDKREISIVNKGDT